MQIKKKISRYVPGDRITLKNATVDTQNEQILIEGYDESGRIIAVKLETFFLPEIQIVIDKKAKVETKPLMLRFEGSTKVNIS